MLLMNRHTSIAATTGVAVSPGAKRDGPMLGRYRAKDGCAMLAGYRASYQRSTLRVPGPDAIRRGPMREFTLRKPQMREKQVGQVDWSGESNGEYTHHTTHRVAADQSGMVVTMMPTLGPTFGVKVMTPGRGSLYAQTGGFPRWLGDTKPRGRPRFSIAPTIIIKDGEPFITLDVAGGLMNPPAIVQVISRVNDREYSLAEAVAAARVAPSMCMLPASYVRDEAALEMTPLNGRSRTDVKGV